MSESIVQTIKSRFEICKKCPHLSPSGLGLKCVKCGCLIKLKISVKSQECPIGKW